MTDKVLRLDNKRRCRKAKVQAERERKEALAILKNMEHST